MLARLPAIDEMFEALVRPGGPGFAVGVMKDGRSVHLGGYGRANLEHQTPITARTIFHVASVSKQFAAFSMALLDAAGSLDLDADVRTYLPYLPDFGHLISTRHLIEHTSGLRDQWALFMLGGQSIDNRLRQAQIISMIKRQRALDFEPGTEWYYSNTGYTLLAEIVREVTGQTLREYTTERIFRPLGMSNTFFYDDVEEMVSERADSYTLDERAGVWKRALLNYDNVGATSLFTTVEDLLEWGRNFRDPVVGTRAIIETITRTTRLRDGSPVNYGFGLQRGCHAGAEAIQHNGADAAFRTYFGYFPAFHGAIVILANHIVPDMTHLVRAIVDIVFNDVPAKAHYHVAEVPLRSDQRAELVGTYVHQYEPPLRIEDRAGEQLSLSIGPNEFALWFREDGTFDTGEAGRSFGVVRNPQGGVCDIEELNALHMGRRRVFHRIEPVSLTTEELAAYCGDYRCPELDITYTFAITDDVLTATTLWMPEPLIFRPVIRDRFAGSFYPLASIVFERDGTGTTTGFHAHGGRLRHVAFERV